MTIYNDVNELWKTAMKDKDPRKDTYSSIRNEIKNFVISNRSSGAGEVVPDDAVSVSVLKKMAKQRKESILEYETGKRSDLAAKEAAELEVIEKFLPKGMPAVELDALVKEVIGSTGATSPKEMGKVMKAVMSKAAGKADGKEVQAAVLAALNSLTSK